MSDIEINQCRQEDSTTWLCENNWAWKNADDHSCEISSETKQGTLMLNDGIPRQFVHQIDKWIQPLAI